MPTLHCAVHCWGCRNCSIWVLEEGVKAHMTKYLIIFSHGIVQFCEFGFGYFFQPELLTDEVDLLLSFLCPFYLCLLELLYRQVVSLSLFVDAIFDSLENKYKLPVKARALTKAPPISIATLAISRVLLFRDALFRAVLV